MWAQRCASSVTESSSVLAPMSRLFTPDQPGRNFPHKVTSLDLAFGGNFLNLIHMIITLFSTTREKELISETAGVLFVWSENPSRCVDPCFITLMIKICSNLKITPVHFFHHDTMKIQRKAYFCNLPLFMLEGAIPPQYIMKVVPLQRERYLKLLF